MSGNKNTYDVTVLGGCSIDQLYYQLEDDTFPDKPDLYVPGGKGANQAVAAARAGAKVNMISKVSNDEAGKEIITNLDRNGVNTTDIEMVEGVANDTTKVFVKSHNGDNEKERKRGVTDLFTPNMIDTYEDDIRSSKVVVAQMKNPKEVTTKLIDLCYENYIPVIVTPCPPEKILASEEDNKKLLNKITYIVCNKEECETIFEKNNIDEILAKYPNKLIVTLGSDGVIYHDGNKVVHLAAIKVDKVVDTIGAGDTFCGNLAASLAAGYPLKEALFRSQFAAAIKVSFRTAQDGMPKKEELDKCITAYRNGQKINWQEIPHDNFTFSEENIKIN